MTWAECAQILKELGLNIRMKRLELGWTQDQLAKATNILGRTSIVNIEQGRQKMTVLTLSAVAKALGVAPGDLLKPATQSDLARVVVGETILTIPANTLEDIINASVSEVVEMDVDNMTAEECYLYARNVLRAPFLSGEKVIAKSASYSYLYARYVLKSAFPDGEAAIAQNAHLAYMYAFDVLRARFPAGEKAIAKSDYYSCLYATYVLKAPYPAGGVVE